jgi:hypothetical protein
MIKATSFFASLALLSVVVVSQVNAGDLSRAGEQTWCASPNECGFSYDFVEVAFINSNSASGADSLAWSSTGVPNRSVVDQIKGVNVQFTKSIDLDFYGVGEFYNTDGLLSSQLVNFNPANLSGDRAEFYYYRVGLGYHHAVMQTVDFTFEAGGLFSNCESSGRTQEEWGWYVSPGLRLSVFWGTELYGSYMYEDFENMNNHRFDGGVVIPVINCVSLKIGGRYETTSEKGSLLAGLRINY